MYADDPLSYLLNVLQRMINICVIEAGYIDMRFIVSNCAYWSKV